MKPMLALVVVVLVGCGPSERPQLAKRKPKEGAFVRVVNLASEQVTVTRERVPFGVALNTASWTPFHQVAPGRHAFVFGSGKQTGNLELVFEPGQRATLVVRESGGSLTISTVLGETRTGPAGQAVIGMVWLDSPVVTARIGDATLGKSGAEPGMGEFVRLRPGPGTLRVKDAASGRANDISVDLEPGGAYTLFVSRLPSGAPYRQLVHNNPKLRLGSVNATVGSG